MNFTGLVCHSKRSKKRTAADSSLEKGEDEEGEDAAIGGAPGTCHGADLGTYTQMVANYNPNAGKSAYVKNMFLGTTRNCLR